MKKRGIGVGSMWYGIGNTAMPNPSGAYIDLLDDGFVILLTGCADIGQGSDTTLAQIAAEELGIDYTDVFVMSGDTGISPDAGATSASRQTYISGNAVRLAANEVKKGILKKAAELVQAPQESIELTEGWVWFRGKKTRYRVKDVLASCRAEGRLTLGSGWFNPSTTALDPETGQGLPYATYAFATQVAELEVDTETGKVDVLSIVAAHDVGTAINPQNVIGQIHGGCAMGMGYALLEEVQVEQGRIKNPGLSQYLIPTMVDMPGVHAIIVEDQEPTGPFGAKGVGEPALIPTAAAVVNAVYNAIGVRITSLPVTPEKVLAALAKKI